MIGKTSCAPLAGLEADVIEFAAWVFGAAVVCAALAFVLFIAAPDERASIRSALGSVAGLSSIALLGMLVIMGLDGIIRAVAISMGF